MNEFVFEPPAWPAVPVRGGGKSFPVRRIYCIGRNYLDHIREMNADERAPPFFFQKPADAIVCDNHVTPYPPATQDLHHEVELVLAIGAGGADIPADAARDHVYGLAVGIDLTRRDLQAKAKAAGAPWEIGKAFDFSAPVGDITPLDGGELPDMGEIRLDVNGVVRQQGDLAQMIWSCEEIIAQLSRQARLQAGDLIFTGTPAGVGPLDRGDRVVARAFGVPDLHVTIG